MVSNLTRSGTYLFWNRRIGEAREARGFPKTGQTTSYDDDDDGDLQIGNPATGTTRFWTQGSVVYDRVTGLYWPADYATAPGSPFDAKVDWATALDNCGALDFAGYADWRLPNYHELASIMDFENGAAFSAITIQVEGANPHWTSTIYQLATTNANAWLDIGPVAQQRPRANSYWVIPVRGGV